MIIQTTQKLQVFFETNGITLPERINEFACWHGNILNINRRKALLLTHNQSLYSIFIYGISKKEMPSLPERIRETLKRQLMKDDFTIVQIEEMLRYSEHFSYFKSSNRKVQGSMKDMALMIKNWVYREGEVDEVEISQRLNQVPYKAIEYSFSKKVLKLLIDDALTYSMMDK